MIVCKTLRLQTGRGALAKHTKSGPPATPHKTPRDAHHQPSLQSSPFNRYPSNHHHHLTSHPVRPPTLSCQSDLCLVNLSPPDSHRFSELAFCCSLHRTPSANAFAVSLRSPDYLPLIPDKMDHAKLAKMQQSVRIGM
jgi:hypothetical protein